MNPVAGEKGLMLEIVKQAIRDAHGDHNKAHERARAKRFIAGNGFNEVCEYIGLDARIARQRIAEDPHGVCERIGRRVPAEEEA